MVRETRHLWVGNLPENIREERIREHFKRYGRVQSVKLLPRLKEDEGSTGLCATVAFMDIKSASKAHNMEHKMDERCLSTDYYEPAAIPGVSTPLYASRFPHGPPEDHPAFDRSTSHFYERRDGEAAYIRRGSTPYHVTDPLRGRARDRIYRNGPYSQIIDRGQPPHHRPIGNSWGYDTPPPVRYPSVPPPTEPYPEERREPPTILHKKRPKSSRSGSESRSHSRSSRSNTRSRSRSHSSSSSSRSGSSSCSSTTSSPRTEKSCSPYSHHSSVRSGRSSGTPLQSAVNSLHSNNVSPIVHSEDRRPLAICVRNLPLRSSDTSLKDGLFHEYKKHGKVTWVKIVGQVGDRERYAIVCFQNPEDVEKALEISHDKLFFGCKIDVAIHQGIDLNDYNTRQYEPEMDEYHRKATRTLFVGNLEKDVTASEIRKHFEKFGTIMEVDIKKSGMLAYAFLQYTDISSVVKAMRGMENETIGGNRLKLGFGKSMPTNCVWVDGISDSVSEKYLSLQFQQFGNITLLRIDREHGQALIFFEQVEYAEKAVRKMRGTALRQRKLQVDFASRECQEAFYVNLVNQGHVDGDEKLWDGYDTINRELSQGRFEVNSSTPNSRFPRYETTQRQRPPSYNRLNSTAVTPPGSTAVGTTGISVRSSSQPRRTGQRHDYYDLDYPERKYRSYDEYSQGSGASHDDPYDPELRDYGYNQHDKEDRTGSPCEIDPLSKRPSQPHVAVGSEGSPQSLPPPPPPPLPPPPDIRHLQKERVHLLNQLEDCISSGDEDSLSVPKKRVKVDTVENGPEVPCITITDDCDEQNRELSSSLMMCNQHKDVTETRRLSDVSSSVKQCGIIRRLSTDSNKKENLSDSVVTVQNFSPSPICKRRKTNNSTSEGEERTCNRTCKHSHHHHHHGDQCSSSMSGGESVDGSRPGTPLCDERPENLLPPGEPRRIPKDRLSTEGPLSLPLPRFAAQVAPGTATRVPGTIAPPPPPPSKPSNILASPPSLSARLHQSYPNLPPPPSPGRGFPPASPGSRPSSTASSDSELFPPSPTLEERIRSLDEKYEKWSGSRAISAAAGEVLAKLDAIASEKFRFRHKILDLDLTDLPPSDIVKSVLSKRSVFDEDSKRLENVGEKYEPKDYQQYGRTTNYPTMRAKMESLYGTANIITSTSILNTPAIPSSTGKTTSILNSPTPQQRIMSAPPPVQSPSHLQKSPFSSALPTTPVIPRVSHPMAPIGVTPLSQSAKVPCVPKPVVSPVIVSRPAVSMPAAKGLQYPFPSHPPNLPTTNIVTLPVCSTSAGTVLSPSPITTLPSVSSYDVTNSLKPSSTIHSSDPLRSPIGRFSATVPTTATSTNPSPEVSSKGPIKYPPLSSAAPIVTSRSPVCNKSISTSSSSSVTVSSSDPRLQPAVSRLQNVETIKTTAPILPLSASLPRVVLSTSLPNDTRVLTACTKPVPVSTQCVTTSSSITAKPVESLTNINKESSPLERLGASQNTIDIPLNSNDSSIIAQNVSVVTAVGTITPPTAVITMTVASSVVPSSISVSCITTVATPTISSTHSDVTKSVSNLKSLSPTKRDISSHSISSSTKEAVNPNKPSSKKDILSPSNISVPGVKKEKESCNKEQDSKHNGNTKSRIAGHIEERRPSGISVRRDSSKDKEKKKDKDDTDKRKNSHPAEIEKRRESADSEKEKRKDKEAIVIFDRRKSTDKETDHEKTKEKEENDKEKRKEKDFTELSEKRKEKDISEHSEKRKEKRKERANSVHSPASIGNKRRMSSQDSTDSMMEDAKRLKLSPASISQEHRKVPERRDSKDSGRSSSSSKRSSCEKSRPHVEKVVKSTEDKSHEDKSHVDHEHHTEYEHHEKAKDKQKKKVKSEKEKESPKEQKDQGIKLSKDNFLGKDFSPKVVLTKRKDDSDPETEKDDSKHKHGKKESKEKKKKDKCKDESSRCKDENSRYKEENNKCKDENYKCKDENYKCKDENYKCKDENYKCKDDSNKCKDDSNKCKDESIKCKDENTNTESQEEKNKVAKKDRDKRGSSDSKKEENIKVDKVSPPQKKENRKSNHTNHTDSESEDGVSEGPKKHSIFDIEDDGPVYISMYDKVKARSTKNMQKQEEEKRQEKMREKFNLLKQSRAKREEKKRSTSWDEDSDSETERDRDRTSKLKRPGKAVISSSSEDGDREERKVNQARSRAIARVKKVDLNSIKSDSDSDILAFRKAVVSEDDDSNTRAKHSTSKKSNRSKLISDTSEDDIACVKFGKSKSSEFYSTESEVDLGFADSESKHHRSSKKLSIKNNKLKNVMDSFNHENVSKKLHSVTKVLLDKNNCKKILCNSKAIKENLDSSDEDSNSNRLNLYNDNKLSNFKKEFIRNKLSKSVDTSEDESSRKVLDIKVETHPEEKEISLTKALVRNKNKTCRDSSDDENARRIRMNSIKSDIFSEDKLCFRKSGKHKSKDITEFSTESSLTNKFLSNSAKIDMFGDDSILEKDELAKSAVLVNSAMDADSDSLSLSHLDRKLYYDDMSEKNCEISRKKQHKKKQKRQKNHEIEDIDIKVESMNKDDTDTMLSADELKSKAERKRHKRERRKSSHSDEKEGKSKPRKKRPPKPELGVLKIETNIKREERMEDIFGPLSDDSDPGIVKQSPNPHDSNEKLTGKWQVSLVYGSDSDSTMGPQLECFSPRPSEKERKKKEKKRKEKRNRDFDGSVSDLVEAGKALEAKLLDEDFTPMTPLRSTDLKDFNHESDSYRFPNDDENVDILVLEKTREKKKKRKKSKEEKQNRKEHHHHHHHEKNKFSPERKLSFVSLDDSKSPAIPSPSLPTLDISSPPSKLDLEEPRSPPRICDRDSTPPPPKILPMITKPSERKKPEKFIPGFGAEIDEDIHDTAVKSISEFEAPKLEPMCIKDSILDKPEVLKDGDPDGSAHDEEEKPRAVISQEETEDAVAAILGESFGGDFNECYIPETETHTSPPQNNVVTEPHLAVEDEEETRQAVEGLIDLKPDTPQSEPDLQIDTDTDHEMDESYSGLRFGSEECSPKTPDGIDFSRPPKTPDFHPSYYTHQSQSGPNKLDTQIIPANIPVALTPSPSRILSPATPCHTLSPATPGRTLSPATPGHTSSPPMTPHFGMESSENSINQSDMKDENHMVDTSDSITKVPELTICEPIRISDSPNNAESLPPILSPKPDYNLADTPSEVITINEDTSSNDSTNEAKNDAIQNISQNSDVITENESVWNRDSKKDLQEENKLELDVSSIRELDVSSIREESSEESTVPELKIVEDEPPISSPEEQPVSSPKTETTKTSDDNILNLEASNSLHSMPKLDEVCEKDSLSPANEDIDSTSEEKQFMPFHFSKHDESRNVLPDILCSIQNEDIPNSKSSDYGVSSEDGRGLSCSSKEDSGFVSNPKEEQSSDIARESDFSEPESDMKSDNDIVTTLLNSESMNPGFSVEDSKSEHDSTTISYERYPDKGVNILSSSKFTDLNTLEYEERKSIFGSPITIRSDSPSKDGFVDKENYLDISSKCDTGNSLQVDTEFWSAKEVNIESVIKKVDALCSADDYIEPVKRTVDSSDKVWFNHLQDKNEIHSSIVKTNIKEVILGEKINVFSEMYDATVKTDVLEKECIDNDEGNKLEIKNKEEVVKEDKLKPLAEESNTTEETNKFISEDTDNLIPKKEENKITPNEIGKLISVERDEIVSDEIPKLITEDSISEKVDQVNDGKTDKFAAEEITLLGDESVPGKAEHQLDKDDDHNHTSTPTDEIEDHEQSVEMETGEESIDQKSVASKTPKRGKKGTANRRKNPTRAVTAAATAAAAAAAAAEAAAAVATASSTVTSPASLTTTIVTRRTRTSSGRKVVDLSVSPKKGARGTRATRTSSQDHPLNQINKKIAADVYEFHDDSEEEGGEKNRPRLILTIKSPVSGTPIIGREGSSKTPQVTPLVETREEFSSPSMSTRKSRRLQERDGSRTTVDDVIDDVIRGTAVLTRSAAATINTSPLPTKRNTRQSAKRTNQPSPATETAKKSPRSGKRKNRASESQEESTDEKKPDEEQLKEQTDLFDNEANNVDDLSSSKDKDSPSPAVPQSPLTKAKVQVVNKKEDLEPTTLIDPVTGLLIPMRQSEEGQYIPVSTGSATAASGNVPVFQNCGDAGKVLVTSGALEMGLQERTTMAMPTCKPEPVTAVTKETVNKVSTTLKAHVLQNTAKNMSPVGLQVSPITPTAKAIPGPIISTLSSIVTCQSKVQQTQSSSATFSSTKTVQSPSSLNSKVHILQAVPGNKPNAIQPGIPGAKMHIGIASTLPTPVSPKSHLLQATATAISTATGKNVMHGSVNSKAILHPTVVPMNRPLSPNCQQPSTVLVAMSGKPSAVPVHATKMLHGMPPQTILTGSVASPPPKSAHLPGQQPIIAGASSSRIAIMKPSGGHIVTQGGKPIMEPPKVDVSMGGIVIPTMSPQSHAQVMQAGMPVPAFEASLHASSGVVADIHPNTQFMLLQSHHQSPSPGHRQGDVVPHVPFPPHVHASHGSHEMVPPHYVPHPQLLYSQYLRQDALGGHIPYHLPPGALRSPMLPGMDTKSLDGKSDDGSVSSPPLEICRPRSAGGIPRTAIVAHALHSPHDRATDSPQIATSYRFSMIPRFYDGNTEAHPPHLRNVLHPHPPTATEAPVPPPPQQRLQVATPPHGSQVPPQGDSLLDLLQQRYPVMWQGLLALKNDQAAVQMHFVYGNPRVAQDSLPQNSDGSTPPLRIAQRMRLEQTQVEGVARKMQINDEHCMLLALPCGRDHMDVLQQSNNLLHGFIMYLQQKQAAGIVNIAAPGSQQAAYVVHIFPACEFANENLERIAPDLLHRVADIAHLLLVIATV